MREIRELSQRRGTILLKIVYAVSFGIDNSKKVKALRTELKERVLGAVLSLIGNKWNVMVVGRVSDGPKRFNELRHLIGGISQRMLTLTLCRLEEEGIVSRTVFSTILPRVDYELTLHGNTLIEPLKSLSDWAIKHRNFRESVDSGE